MKYFSSIPLKALASTLICLGGLQMVQADNKENKDIIDVEDPKIELIESPQFDTRNPVERQRRHDPKEWLELFVEIEMEENEQLAKVGIYDNITVNWFAVVNDPETKKPLLFKREVEHVNIPVGEKILISTYLSPNSMKRLQGGSDRIDASVVEVFGGEILIDGNQVGYFSSKTMGNWPEEPWWKSSSLSTSEVVQLLVKNETPFKPLWYDKYADLKVED